MSTATPPGSEAVQPAVEFDGVSHSYRTRGAAVHALEDVNLTFAPGEFVALVGPSGCGKTTLLQALAGFIIPEEGTVLVDGVRVRKPSWERGVVFQRAELFPWLTVQRNIEFGPRMRRRKRAERQQHARELLTLVGLDGFGDRRPYELSGGMQQRCQIARVLANDPEIMLMDEPFGALDAFTRERLQAELHRIWLETHKTVFFVTHSVEEAVLLSTRIVALSDRPGRVVLDTPAPFAEDERGLEALRTDASFIELQQVVRQAIAEGSVARL
jgi:ABC-type nitrate/sulfonate/bicarbonate transport system ATPase subunit